MSKNNQSITICYILSLGHSGSTVLDRTLASLPGAVGLGETYALLSGKEQNFENTSSLCSCGNQLLQCEYWSGLKDLNKNCQSPEEFINAYQQIIAHAQQQGYSHIIDSSKKPWLLEYLNSARFENVEIKTIYLVRDVRGWAASRRSLAAREGKSTILVFIRAVHNWFLNNLRLLNFLKKGDYTWSLLSYESFVLDHENSINSLTKYLNIDTSNAAEGADHIVFGNRTKLNDQKHLRYDTRWFNVYHLSVYLFIFPYIGWLNSLLSISKNGKE
ncbi:sulfotransferase [Candidatus Saccharibacteria bacterium]|nr:sulfotransferase [Candidatus Saccharibacteria bacterium]